MHIHGHKRHTSPAQTGRGRHPRNEQGSPIEKHRAGGGGAEERAESRRRRPQEPDQRANDPGRPRPSAGAERSEGTNHTSGRPTRRRGDTKEAKQPTTAHRREGMRVGDLVEGWACGVALRQWSFKNVSLGVEGGVCKVAVAKDKNSGRRKGANESEDGVVV